jgi:hypothetical protein
MWCAAKAKGEFDVYLKLDDSLFRAFIMELLVGLLDVSFLKYG